MGEKGRRGEGETGSGGVEKKDASNASGSTPHASCLTPHASLLPGERLDALGRGGLRIIQNPDLFRFTTDAYLLAAFARPKQGETVLELGSGSGVVLILLAARTGLARAVGLEIQPVLADLAARNISLNGLAERALVLRHDLRVNRTLDPPSFDLVVANPPYIPAAAGRLSPKGPLAQAKHELTCNLRDVVEAAARWVKHRGRFVLVHRPERLPEIMAELARVRLVPKKLALVHPDPTSPAAHLLVEARHGAKPGLAVGPPLCVRDTAGVCTAAMEEVYAGRWPGEI